MNDWFPGSALFFQHTRFSWWYARAINIHSTYVLCNITWIIRIIQSWIYHWMFWCFLCVSIQHFTHGPLDRYVKLRVVHAPGMPGTLSPSSRVTDPDMHQGTCVTHVPKCMPGSLTSCVLWNRWRKKRSRHSRCMRNPQFIHVCEILLNCVISTYRGRNKMTAV